MVKLLLDRFIQSNPKYYECGTTNIEGMFTLGKQVDTKSLGLFKCSWCGALTGSKELRELHEHMHSTIGAWAGIGI